MIQYDHHVKIYYKDIDQMGIVYYSRYFEFFEAARTEMLSSIGLDYVKVEKKGAMLPVIEAHAEYKKGAKFSQDIIVKISIEEVPKVKLKIDYTICRKDSNEVLVKGYTIHASTSLDGKPIRMPNYIRAIFKKNLEKQ